MKTKNYIWSLIGALCMASCQTKENEQQGQEYTVTFQYETSGSSYKVVQAVKESALLTPPSDTVYREVYKVQGWSSSPFEVILWNFETNVVTKDITLYAYLKLPVIFDYAGKAVNDTAWVNDLIPPVQRQAVTAPITTPEVDHFAIDGWYRSASLTTLWNFAADKVGSANTRIYAKWVPAYIVNYNTQGGSEVARSNIKQNTLLPHRPKKPVNPDENLLFFGWYKEPECTNLWDFYSEKVNSDITLYARWHSIATTGMDFSVYLVSCGSKQFKVLNDDLPGLYKWTEDGKGYGNFYNPCPNGWTVPTYSELVCMQNQLRLLKSHVDMEYWSRERDSDVCYDNGTICHARILTLGINGDILSGYGRFLGGDARIRCVKYD